MKSRFATLVDTPPLVHKVWPETHLHLGDSDMVLTVLEHLKLHNQKVIIMGVYSSYEGRLRRIITSVPTVLTASFDLMEAIGPVGPYPSFIGIQFCLAGDRYVDGCYHLYWVSANIVFSNEYDS